MWNTLTSKVKEGHSRDLWSVYWTDLSPGVFGEIFQVSNAPNGILWVLFGRVRPLLGRPYMPLPLQCGFTPKVFCRLALYEYWTRVSQNELSITIEQIDNANTPIARTLSKTNIQVIHTSSHGCQFRQLVQQGSSHGTNPFPRRHTMLEASLNNHPRSRFHPILTIHLYHLCHVSYMDGHICPSPIFETSHRISPHLTLSRLPNNIRTRDKNHLWGSCLKTRIILVTSSRTNPKWHIQINSLQVRPRDLR